MAPTQDTEVNCLLALRWIDDLGGFGLVGARRILEMLYILANAVSGLFSIQPGNWRYLRQITIQQIYFTASQSTQLMLFVGLVLGVLTMLPLYGFHVTQLDLVARVVKVALFYQVIPLITALLVIGRSGAAITAELGEMQANQTIDTLLGMGIEPHQFLVLPRLAAVAISLFILAFWGGIAAVIGAALFASFFAQIPFEAFIGACRDNIDLLGMVGAAVLTFFLGSAIALVYCHFGFRSRTALETARNLPRAFVGALVTCVLITLVFAVVLNG